jgi:hypothetical protein
VIDQAGGDAGALPEREEDDDLEIERLQLVQEQPGTGAVLLGQNPGKSVATCRTPRETIRGDAKASPTTWRIQGWSSAATGRIVMLSGA